MRAADDEPAPSDERPLARVEQPDRHRRSIPEDRTEDDGAAAEATPQPYEPAPTGDADAVPAAAAAPVLVQDAAPATPAHGGDLAGAANPGIAAPPTPGAAATPLFAGARAQAPTPPQAATAPPAPPLVPGQAATAPPAPPLVPGSGTAGQRLPQPIVLTQRFALPLSRPTAHLTAGTSLIPAQAAASAAAAGAAQTIDSTTEAASQLAVGKLPTAGQKLLHRPPGTAKSAAATGAKGPTAAAPGSVASIAGGTAQGAAPGAATSAQTFAETLLAGDATADTRAPGANAKPSFATGGGAEGTAQLSVDGPRGPNHLTAAARPTGSPAAAPRPHQPVHQIAVQIQQGLKQGSDLISIRLHPASLGRVEVRMEVGHDKTLQAVIMVEKAETLELLSRDARSLQQALEDAGLTTNQESLTFRHGDTDTNGKGGDDTAATGHGDDPDEAEGAAAGAAAYSRHDGAIDIHV